MTRAEMAVQFGALRLGTPVMLAPMAGVTNPPFRRLCREQAELALASAGLDSAADGSVPGTHAPAGLWVCEMITSRALVERNAETMNMIEPDAGDPVRSIQLYGVEPKTMASAVEILVGEDRADHIDLNFGCPAPKVTRKGGGSALPWKLDLFEELVTSAVDASRRASADRDFEVPVTAKIRVGIDEEHGTFLDAARIAEQAGVAGLTLHARTTAQHYSGRANWESIAQLAGATTLPVLGNGDVFEADDALALMEATRCDGVAIGRGCQGRPWLFFDLAAALHGSAERARPGLAEVAATIRRHGELSVEHFDGDENRAMRELRKHITWYLRGFSVGGQSRNELALVSTMAELEDRLAGLELDQAFPEAAHGPRGRAGSPKCPHLPDGWLDSRVLTAGQRSRISAAEIGVSGG
ncbi:MAG: tRNA dihydrouridine synthase DusB [Actinomycetaceae bacterium]|nr:tRNA dihydrouridine synthase DusB [Actinomycetaceae bacterium]